MNSLRVKLVLTYIIIIILLLLSLMRCEGSDLYISDSHDSIMPIEKDPVPDKHVIREKFKADVVMCIDCTGSMEMIINTIKHNALNFYPDLKERCKANGKEIISMRIKVIGFRDFEDAKSFEQSVFFDIPTHEADFRSFVSGLYADGGGDSPERGYDALGLAMMSEWRSEPDVHQVIILWTDNASHRLSVCSPGPKSMNELTSLWNDGMSQEGKRLILFAPDHQSWTALERDWSRTIRHDVNEGGGLSDIDYDEILRTLSESI